MPDRFDVVVVGAGPAGSAAALAVARAGRSVCLVERGSFPGAKNMYGGVVYGRVLDGLVPGWWETVPVQRWVTRRSTMVMTEEQALTVDFRTEAWGRPPYNGMTTYRADFDRWLAGIAERAGATVVCSTLVTGLVRTPAGGVAGVRTDRADGELLADVVIACDGVNSFLAKESGLYRQPDPAHFTLGVKEVLGLPPREIERRFNVVGDQGADIEVLGATSGVPGGGFVHTNRDSVAVGLVLAVSELARRGLRPEELLDRFKRHPAVAPLVADGVVREYSAHLIPEGGYDTMPDLVADGLLVAGDAAGMCLAAGLYLEGVNFAIGSGAAAGETAVEALAAGDQTAAGLAGYRRRLESSFVLRDHRRFRRLPSTLLAERMQSQYPKALCDVVESMFTVRNPEPKAGVGTLARGQLRAQRLRLRTVARDAWTVLRSFG